MSDYRPTPEHKFTFGLWTVGWVGQDPFGGPTRRPLDPHYTLGKLAEIGAYGTCLHDNDLIPITASAAERDRIVKDFKRALDDNGLVCAMTTANLAYDPAFKEGSLTSADARVRAYALQKVLATMDVGAELGAKVYVFWGGREGSEVDAAGNHVDAFRRLRDAYNYVADYADANGYDMRFAIEPKPNEPRGDAFMATVGSALGLISTLDKPEKFGLNPEFAHETMAGLNFVHAVAQALDAGKLFHIDLNDQKMNRYDQDLRFGSENLKSSFFLVKLLEESGYDGVRHFDAHALRTEDEEGVWDFAKGCMRSYLILKEKAERFAVDAEIQAAIAAVKVEDEELAALTGTYSAEAAATLKSRVFDRATLGSRRTGLERLDQLTVELLLGVR